MEEIDHIAELQKRLYARDPESVPQRKYGILRPVKQTVDSTWGETNIPKPKKERSSALRGYRRFFMFSLLFLLIAAGAAFYTIYKGAATLSSKNVEVTILGNSFIGAGQELPLAVEITNKNATTLDKATLTLSYPKGAGAQQVADQVHTVQTIGTIGSGKNQSQAFSIYLYGEQGTTQTITATLDYTLSGSTSTFEKIATFPVTINSSPVDLTVTAPPAAASNQNFTLTINTTFNGDQPISGALVHVDYPQGFVFLSSIPAPVASNNVWSLGDLEKGTNNTISVTGKLIGEEQDQKAFRVYVGTPVSDTDNTINLSYSSALATMTIEQPFISGTITIDTQTRDQLSSDSSQTQNTFLSGDASTTSSTANDTIAAVPYGTPISGIISWTNNGPIAVTNPTFTLSLDNDAIDFDSIVADGANIDALNHTITWTPQSDSDLSTIAAGATGKFTFSFGMLAGNTNPGDVTLGLSVSGTFPDRNNATSTLNNIDQKIIRFASQLQFASESKYSIGPIQNTGPFPPKANTETTYTITWTILPVENALQNVMARATLPTGVLWTGVVNPMSGAIAYDPATGSVVWNVGTLAKAAPTTKSQSISFQVKVKPTKAQISSMLQLLGETTITARDAVANVPISVTRPGLTTQLFTDPAYTPGKEKVLP